MILNLKKKSVSGYILTSTEYAAIISKKEPAKTYAKKIAETKRK